MENNNHSEEQAAAENLDKVKQTKNKKCGNCGTTGGCFWFLGFIGALIFYIQHADSFGAGVVGFFKALVWPAILVYKLLLLLI